MNTPDPTSIPITGLAGVGCSCQRQNHGIHINIYNRRDKSIAHVPMVAEMVFHFCFVLQYFIVFWCLECVVCALFEDFRVCLGMGVLWFWYEDVTFSDFRVFVV